MLIIGGVSLGIAFFQVTIEKNIFQHTPGGVKTQYMHCWAENQNLVLLATFFDIPVTETIYLN